MSHHNNNNGGPCHDNGNTNGRKMDPLELEMSSAMQSMPVQSSATSSSGSKQRPPAYHGVSQPQQQQQQQRRRHPIEQVCLLLRLYMEYYPKVTSSVAVLAVIALLYWMMASLQTPVTRNRLHRHYAQIDYDYNFQAAQMEHWCLFGRDDTSCPCEEFTDPVPGRLGMKSHLEWQRAHQANVQMVQQLNKRTEYDVVFVGDGVVEAFNGTAMSRPYILDAKPEGKQIREYWDETFTRAGGGEFEGLALGIAGDSTSNLLWRLQHGELSTTIRPKVWWIMIGANDLDRGGCSEEATTLGILRTAEEIHYHHEDAVIVIQGILPRTSKPDGSLNPTSSFFGRSKRVFSPDQAKKEYLLWPSIQNINAELADFCSQHEHTVYFDASSLFIGKMSTERGFSSQAQHIVRDLMPDYAHLSYVGMTILGDAIEEELERILFDDDEENDIEERTRGRQRRKQQRFIQSTSISTHHYE